MGGRIKQTVDVTVYNKAVTGSCILMCIHRKEKDINFLIDCGISQGEESSEQYNYADFAFNPERVDFLLLTHVHADHSARIPLLYKRGFKGKTYCSQATAKLLKCSLKNAQKVLGINAKNAGKKPLYDEMDVEKALQNVEVVPYMNPFMPEIQEEGSFTKASDLKVRPYKNAHLPGASLYAITYKCPDGGYINVFVTGDYATSNMFFNVRQLPDRLFKYPTHIISEATYGTTDSSDVEKGIFSRNIQRWVGEGRTIIIPTLSLRRYQEIALTLRNMQKSGVLDTSVPIYFDGPLGIEYTMMYPKLPGVRRSLPSIVPDNSQFVGKNRDAIISDRSCKIVVSTSGSGCYGPSAEYIQQCIEDHNSAIHFTSYLWKDCLGERILRAEQGEYVDVGSVLKRKRAEVCTTSEFSAHAKRDELLQLYERFEQLKTIILCHGEPEVKEAFGRYILRNMPDVEVAIGGTGQTIRLDNRRIVKTFTPNTEYLK